MVVRSPVAALSIIAPGRLVMTATAIHMTSRAIIIDDMRRSATPIIGDRMLQQMQSLTAQRCDQIGKSAQQNGEMSNQSGHHTTFCGRTLTPMVGFDQPRKNDSHQRNLRCQYPAAGCDPNCRYASESGMRQKRRSENNDLTFVKGIAMTSKVQPECEFGRNAET